VARRNPGPDPKAAALAETRCLNPHPEAVRDAAFLGSEFFDARDVVQVKYEMVRRVKAEDAPVTQAAAAFGFSRPSYYQAAARLEESGLAGLVRPQQPARPPEDRPTPQTLLTSPNVNSPRTDPKRCSMQPEVSPQDQRAGR